MNARNTLVVCGLVLASATLMTVRNAAVGAESGSGQDSNSLSAVNQPLCGGEPCDAVARGAIAFDDRRLQGLAGNGRSCADCHMPTDQFQLSPAKVEARFQFLQWMKLLNRHADDPLFRPIDADDFRTNGDQASDFSNLRQNALVRIALPLPPTIKLIDPATNLPSSATEVDVWRSVPTVNDVKLTGPDGENPWFRGPNETGGYQLDARIANLQDQALGALRNHASIQNVPPQRLLDDLASFQRVLFTNDRVRALSDAIDAGVTPLPDPDPPLDVLEQQGKAVFQRACAQCHGGPRQSTTPFPIVRMHDILAQCPRPVDGAPVARWAFKACPDRLATNARTYEVTLAVPTPTPAGVLPPGTKIRRVSSDPGRALLTGFVGGPPPFDDWNHFDVPALRGISRTAPYFHNNSADSLEEVVDHYIELFKFIKATTPPGVPPPPVSSTDGINHDRAPLPSERAALLAYLRKL
jgi:cytochrome c peroxidase